MKVKLKKSIQYGDKYVLIGTVGEVVHIDPLTFKGYILYDYYVKFPNMKPIGMFKNEVEEVSTTKSKERDEV